MVHLFDFLRMEHTLPKVILEIHSAFEYFKEKESLIFSNFLERNILFLK